MKYFWNDATCVDISDIQLILDEYFVFVSLQMLVCETLCDNYGLSYLYTTA